LTPPRFTYRPWPATHRNEFTGIVPGAFVVGTSRAPSTITCFAVHVTLAARNEPPSEGAQSAVFL